MVHVEGPIDPHEVYCGDDVIAAMFFGAMWGFFQALPKTEECASASRESQSIPKTMDKKEQKPSTPAVERSVSGLNLRGRKVKKQKHPPLTELTETKLLDKALFANPLGIAKETALTEKQAASLIQELDKGVSIWFFIPPEWNVYDLLFFAERNQQFVSHLCSKSRKDCSSPWSGAWERRHLLRKRPIILPVDFEKARGRWSKREFRQHVYCVRRAE